MAQAQVVLGGGDLEATTDFFADLGFRLLMIMPADDPQVAVLEGFGLSIRLDTSLAPGSTMLRLPADERTGETITAPNGTMIELVAVGDGLALPPLDASFVLSRVRDASWTVGRAGMGYRDLLPDRQGGRFVASHIRIADGGPVPDYVHHHAIRFQMIYCHRGWARLVYEDQGPPFRFEAGDCVLQPPHIRHQVLETSSGFEVVEIGCPAEHETLRDHDLALPTSALVTDRTYGGQRFVHHRRASATWSTADVDGYEQCDLGIGAATAGLAGARMIRASPGESALPYHHDGELLFWFVRDGEVHLETGSEGHALTEADSVVLAPGEDYLLSAGRVGFELLEVTLPGQTGH